MVGETDEFYRGLVSTKAVVVDNHNVALVKNRRGHWDLPGGKVERGESLHDALQREMAEELGIQVAQPRQLLDAVFHPFFDDILVLVYRCEVSGSAELRGSEEHTEVRWFALADLSDLDVPAVYHSALARVAGSVNQVRYEV